MMYEVYTNEFGNEIIRRVVDNAFIPADESNQDYQSYLLWKETN